MKKSTLVLACLLGCSATFAQDLTSKKGETILPEAGDWSIGVDAAPFLNYFGRFLSNAGGTAPTFEFLDGSLMHIVGKRYVDETTAQRAILRLGFTSSSSTAMIGDASSTTPPTFPNLPAMVEDKMKSSNKHIGIGAGIEKRRGKTRLQGLYGADGMIVFMGSSESYEYGNAMTATSNAAAISSNFGTNITTDTYGNAARVTKMKGSSTFGIVVRGFIGAEYFILPKISVGGEFGWGLLFGKMTATSTTTESSNGTNTGTQTIESGKGGAFGIDVDQNMTGTGNGTLRLNFHF
ncbi:MAG: hypothetical protein H6585_07545 [Flavobacteriales bacterium]|nr:hypothetical protein [Flavobacteriales bacterium]MCB9448180.1 hypothetical protein [Flavobacteriales bacterium]